MSCIADDPDQAVCTWRDGLEVEAVSPSSQMDDLARLGWDLVTRRRDVTIEEKVKVPAVGSRVPRWYDHEVTS